MTINFGVKPARASWTLTDDADFYSTVQTRDLSNFPATAVISVVFVDAAGGVLATYTATGVGATATFNVDKAVIAALLLTEPAQGRLFYQDGVGGPELLMAKGPINDESD